MKHPIQLILAVFLFSPHSDALSLQQYLKNSSSDAKTLPPLSEVTQSQFVSPIQSLEYTWSGNDILGENSDQGTDIFKLNFVSFREMSHTVTARNLQRQLNQQILRYHEDSRQYMNFLKALTQVFEVRTLEVSASNKVFFDKYLSSLSNSLEANSLKRLLDAQTKLALMEKTTISAQDGLSSADRKQVVEELLENTTSLASAILSKKDSLLGNSLEKAELALEKIDDTIKETSLVPQFSHIEFRQDRDSHETSFRFGIEIPFYSLDDGDRRRKALTMAKEVRLAVQEKQQIQEQNLALKDLHSLSVELRILLERKDKLIALSQRRKGPQSSNMLTTSKIILYETEMELIEKGNAFYQKFLKICLDASMFSQHSDRNLLIPGSWKDI